MPWTSDGSIMLTNICLDLQNHQEDYAVANSLATQSNWIERENTKAAGDGSPYFIETPRSHGGSIDGASTCPTEASVSESDSFLWEECSAEDDEVLQEDHLFLESKPLAVARVFEAFHSWRGTSFEQDIPSAGGGNSSPEMSQGKEKGKDSATGKRSWANHSESSKDITDGSGHSSNQTTASKRRRTSDRKVTFACPYTKKDPMSYRDCYKYTLSRIRDVKQHLARCHRNPPYCPRCMDSFETEEERDDHIRVFTCPSRPSFKRDGITESQRLQLSKKSASNTSPEAQWFAVFDILFPEHNPRPQSPYIDSELLQDITLYQDFLTSNGPRILSEVLNERGAITWNLPSEERDLAAFQQSIFEEGLRAIFDQWLARRSNGNNDLNVPSSSGNAAEDTIPSSFDSSQTTGPTLSQDSGAVPPDITTSGFSGAPADAFPAIEVTQGLSSGQDPCDGEFDEILAFGHETVDFPPGSIYGGLDYELTQLVTDTQANIPFQPNSG